MAADDAIKRAKGMIGEGEPDDYVISPTRHAGQFKAEAPELAAILSSSAVLSTARQYENEDRDALAAQGDFKRVFNRTNLSVLATGVFVALVMATGAAAGVLPEWTEKTFLVILSLGGVVCGALATKGLLTIRQGGLLEDWMSKRAAAETARLDYFERVAKSPAEGTAARDRSLQLLQLEYFRRFQFDVQLAYYRERAKDHRDEAQKTLSYSGWAVFGAAIAAGAAGVLGASVNPRLAAVGALGAVFTGLSSFAAMREAVHQNRRNAERYGRTYRVLEDLNRRLDDVRKTVHAHGGQPLSDFVDAVHEQLSLEHRQWLAEQSEARGAFAKLERTLKELSSDGPAGADPAGGG